MRDREHVDDRHRHRLGSCKQQRYHTFLLGKEQKGMEKREEKEKQETNLAIYMENSIYRSFKRIDFMYIQFDFNRGYILCSVVYL